MKKKLRGHETKEKKVYNNSNAIALDQDRDTRHIEKQVDFKDFQNVGKK